MWLNSTMPASIHNPSPAATARRIRRADVRPAPRRRPARSGFPAQAPQQRRYPEQQRRRGARGRDARRTAARPAPAAGSGRAARSGCGRAPPGWPRGSGGPVRRPVAPGSGDFPPRRSVPLNTNAAFHALPFVEPIAYGPVVGGEQQRGGQPRQRHRHVHHGGRSQLQQSPHAGAGQRRDRRTRRVPGSATSDSSSLTLNATPSAAAPASSQALRPVSTARTTAQQREHAARASSPRPSCRCAR